MSYIVKLINGDTLEITDSEFSSLKGKDGAVYIPSAGDIINTKSITRVLSKDKYETELREQNQSLTEGRLRDGTRVVKKFGQWVLAEDTDVVIDGDHYPEIRIGSVLPEETWLAIESGKIEMPALMPQREVSEITKMLQ